MKALSLPSWWPPFLNPSNWTWPQLPPWRWPAIPWQWPTIPWTWPSLPSWTWPTLAISAFSILILYLVISMSIVDVHFLAPMTEWFREKWELRKFRKRKRQRFNEDEW